MKTILVTSQKGGSGKTTLVAHLAVESTVNQVISKRMVKKQQMRWRGKQEKCQ